MPYRTTAKNVMLDALAGQIATASLHTAFPPTDANEITGGTPAYARKAIAFNPAAGGAIDDLTAPAFDIPAGVTVSAAAYRNAAGAILADADLPDESFTGQGTYTLTDTDLDLNAV